MKGYDRFGVMLDCSRDGVLKIEEVEKFASALKKLGYDSVMLYTEDTYEVKNQPYFGYMRGGYSSLEIKKLDATLKKNGIELIPCVQTLAHYTNLCKLPQYADVIDVNDILLIDEEKTYALIDDIFATLAENFTSRLVNIGMDEAHMVGLGKYLDKHGYVDRIELLIKHLDKVCLIAEKYGFKPLMWSDMFFRLINGGDYYGKNRSLPERIKKLMPENVSLAYWDYYHKNKSDYDEMFKAHLETGRDVWFFGGAWTWAGFAPLNEYSILTMLPAMQSAKEAGVKNVFMTMWGDNGSECSFNAVLPALCRIAAAALGEDEAYAKKLFAEVSDIPYDDFIKLDLPNKRADIPCNRNENLAKCLFYSDPFTGYFDYNLENVKIDYAGYAEKFDKYRGDAVFGDLFSAEADLCKFLNVKYDLGVRTRKAYKSGDKTAIKELSGEYEKAAELLEIFYESFKKLWFKEKKPFGFEVHEARMGGLTLRLKSCGKRLADYAAGKTNVIEELEKNVLSMTDEDFMHVNRYEYLVSFSKIG